MQTRKQRKQQLKRLNARKAYERKRNINLNNTPKHLRNAPANPPNSILDLVLNILKG